MLAVLLDTGLLRVGEVLSHLPGVASHFVSAEVKHFSHDKKNAAMDWISQAE